jgi:hypothetical protein
MKLENWSSATILGLLAAFAGVVTPIIWDHYKTKSSIELDQLASTVVASSSEELNNLTLMYNNVPVAALTKIDFLLSNTGRTPIRKEDVVSPIVISVDDGRILDFKLSSVQPAGLVINPELDDSHTKSSISFPLLNPDDKAHFTLLISGKQPHISVNARIAGIADIAFIDHSQDKPTIFRRLSFGTYVTALFTAFSLLLFFVSLYKAGSEGIISRFWRTGVVNVSFNTTPGELKKYIDDTFSEEKKVELKGFNAFLSSLPQNSPLLPVQQQEAKRLLDIALGSLSSVIGVSFMLGILSLIGVVYILQSIIGHVQ